MQLLRLFTDHPLQSGREGKGKPRRATDASLSSLRSRTERVPSSSRVVVTETTTGISTGADGIYFTVFEWVCAALGHYSRERGEAAVLGLCR